MTDARKPLELLAPARSADFGIEAVIHGADAVYIGGPAFGARAGAGNTVADIERLAAFAHRYHAKVFVALNTILRDDELDEARRVAWQVFEAGADALIVQDMGLLELDLPPIELHASTQTDIRSADKARFLGEVGFSQIVLARELAIPQIRKIAGATDCRLEFFVHGALCVSYSGQCYISHAHTGRSANRGECSQACRLPYDLADQEGRIVTKDKHLLSMKDNDQSANLRALIEAGIGSFKIEGRLKDLAYVKNITAHYRTLLDAILEDSPGYRRASSGRSHFLFTPQPEKTFNRGATDYFVNGRHADIGAFDTPSFAGTAIGSVLRVGKGWFDVESREPLNNGDGLSYFDAGQELAGLRVNTAQKVGGAWRCTPNEMPEDLVAGGALYRNRDQAFERALEKTSAERRVTVSLHLAERDDGFALTIVDEDGISATACLVHGKDPAQNPQRALTTLRDNLAKLGNTMFASAAVDLALSAPWFLPVGAINALRRDAVAALEAARLAAHVRAPRKAPADPPAQYPEDSLTYLGNVYNAKARAFYARHGVRLIDAAYESNGEKGEVSLMITKHCLRYSYNLCPKEVKGLRPDPMTLIHGKDTLTLRFDCKKCEMHVVGRLKKSRPIMLTPAAAR